MDFFKRLFNRKEVPDVARMRGGSAQQTQVEQRAQTQRMEAEVAADRLRRGATDVRPGTVPPPEDTPHDADDA